MLNQLEDQLYTLTNPKSLSQIFGLEKTAMEFCASLILRFFRHNNVILKPGVTLSTNSCFSALHIQPQFKRMFYFFLSTLSKNGIIKWNEEEINVLIDIEKILAPSDLLNKIRTLYPKFHFFFSFLEQCSLSYPNVLSGKQSATEVLFPSNDPLIIKKVYENTPKMGHEDLYLHLAKEYLYNHLVEGSSVIEIGGGQGLLTEILLPEIYDKIDSYYFTDIGASFIKDASSHWGTIYPKIKCSLLDISKDPISQGFEKDSFDAIVGFNVIHATPNIIESLNQILKIVKKKGTICLIENVKIQPWIDMIYGLTEGWWAFNDGIRLHSPLLTLEQWETILQRVEVSNAIVLPLDKRKRTETDTTLIVIEK